MSPTEPFGKALGDFIQGEVDYRRKITQERVDSVHPDGTVVIRGTILPMTGAVPVLPGETVAVAWRNGKMDVVLLNQGRRGGAGASFVTQAVGIVEELFYDGLNTVWFRNEDQMIKVVESVPASARGIVHWGIGSSDFFCVENITTSGGTAVVYRLNRPTQNEPFPKGFKIKASVFETYDLNSNLVSLASVTVVLNTPTPVATATGTLSYYTFIAAVDGGNVAGLFSAPQFAGIAPNGDLFVTVGATASAGISAQTLLDTIGSVLVNAKTHSVLASHVPSLYTGTVFLDASCVSLGTIEIDLTPGVAFSDSGNIVLLSMIQGLGSPPPPPTFNNYALIGPSASTTNVLTCGSPQTFVLKIIGEFGQIVGSFPSPQAPKIQSSRTRMLLAAYDRFSFAPLGHLLMRDLRRQLQADIGTDPDAIFGIAGSNPAALVHNRQLLETHADLTYSPKDLARPFNRQFFVAGTSATAIKINQAALKKRPELANQAKLAPVTVTEKVAGITGATSSDVQVLDSRVNLGNLFQSGPL